MTAQCASIVPSTIVLPDFYRILKLAVKRLTSTVDSRLSPLGLDHEAYSIVSVLLLNPNGCDLCTVEQITDVSAERILSIVANLKNRHIVERETTHHHDGTMCHMLNLEPVVGVAMAEAAEQIVDRAYTEIAGCPREICRCVARLAGLFPESDKVEKPSNVVPIAAFGAFAVHNDTVPTLPL